MGIINKITDVDGTKKALSNLWIVVMFNIIFADILSFITPGFFDRVNALEINPTMLLVFAVLLEIPIMMIFLSRILERAVNRWVNIISGIVTMLFVVIGGSSDFHYIFFATIEVLLIILIVVIAWKWPESKRVIQ